MQTLTIGQLAKRGDIKQAPDGTLYVTDPAHGRVLAVRWNPPEETRG